MDSEWVADIANALLHYGRLRNHRRKGTSTNRVEVRGAALRLGQVDSGLHCAENDFLRTEAEPLWSQSHKSSSKANWAFVLFAENEK